MKIRAVIWFVFFFILASWNVPTRAAEADAGDGVQEEFFKSYPDLRNEREAVSQAAQILAAEGNQTKDARLAAEVLANRTRAILVERTPLEWQRKAVSLYPELGVADSQFNALFLQHYRELQTTSPKFSEEPSWPVLLAERCADELRTQGEPAASAKAVPPSTAVAPSSPQPPRVRAGFWQSAATLILLLVVLALPAKLLLRKNRGGDPSDAALPASHPIPPWRQALKPAAGAYALAALAGLIRTFIANADQSFFDRFGITFLVSLLLGALAALPTFACATVLYSFRQYRGAAPSGSEENQTAAAKIIRG